jgi:DNA-binding transcriptional ArsR family regulator
MVNWWTTPSGCTDNQKVHPEMNQYIFAIQAEFCRAMGSAVRLHLLHILREHPLTVSDISQEINLPQGTVSRQLSVLHNVGVVTSRKVGNTRVYQITDDKIAVFCDLVRTILVDQIHERSMMIEKQEHL